MVRWIVAVVLILIVVFFVYVNFANKAPEDLGVTDGFLKACPSTPNCVSSQADIEDSAHYFEPIVYFGTRKETQLKIESYLLNQGRARIVKSELGYVYFEVKSKLIGYIDDVEFYLPEGDSVVHFRSASRVGYSDRGVNRERIAQVRELLADQTN
ncbi:DUF1499 domain-containing protein [Marinomonas sp. C2222]|uniref:DUF1499 domain-containing protein n=1 Tax=Marinomonas sargassi TaxID=2984494 RepID=A0ABT2YN78_9GAMM|nr:DUF1499 domain-containing protein [Marinomonas sargassi]MCV2401343.1 DUF1499 domain-containing protein [Marinomonas sargassi]